MEKVKKILLVSNGHAEDLAAAAIGAKIREMLPGTTIKALPLVGLGKAYDKQGIENLGLKVVLPSGGFAKEGIFHFIKDIWSGLLGILFAQIRILKIEAQDTDLILAVGDAYVVGLCGFFAGRPLIFVDGPKSVKIAGYWPLELWLMKRFCRQIVVQDQATADHLQKKHLPALYLGSWVMDYVPATGETFGLDQSKIVLGLLPGTREEAYNNLMLILELVDLVNRSEKVIGLAASTLDLEKIKRKLPRSNWQFNSPTPAEAAHNLTGKLLSRRGATVLISSGKFADVCLRSKLIIALAGIANEQAVAFGRPVVCFPGTGAQTTLRRWEEIQKITGDSMLILKGNQQEKAERIIALLHDHRRLEEMGRIGKASKPQWGGVAKIAELICYNAVSQGGLQ